VKKVTAQWDREQAKILLENGRWMPAWLLKMFREIFGSFWLKVAFQTLEARAAISRNDQPEDTNF